jgi:hypothetical protein
MSDSSSNGTGFAALLTIAFVVLKLTGYINWSWIWVVAPVWISITVGLIIIAVLHIFFK